MYWHYLLWIKEDSFTRCNSAEDSSRRWACEHAPGRRARKTAPDFALVEAEGLFAGKLAMNHYILRDQGWGKCPQKNAQTKPRKGREKKIMKCESYATSWKNLLHHLKLEKTQNSPSPLKNTMLKPQIVFRYLTVLNSSETENSTFSKLLPSFWNKSTILGQLFRVQLNFYEYRSWTRKKIFSISYLQGK